jgi:signal recognition particle subunit SRP54
VAKSFDEKLSIDGVIVTKLDSDTRGGAALSVRAVTGKPIKFAGTGEKLGDIEPFHPERMANRILGMGDVLSLIEKAEEAFDEEQAKKLEEKLLKNKFDLEDYLGQIVQMKKMGGAGAILGSMGVKQKDIDKADINEKIFDRQAAIILSMTPKERSKPDILAASRKRRIAQGAGVEVSEDRKRVRERRERLPYENLIYYITEI